MAKKKTVKQQDFKKAKLRVGKPKAKPTGYTDLSFKSKAVLLPNQSITGTPGPSQTFDHSIALTNHHSPSVRKDALIRIRQNVNLKKLSPLLSAVSRLVLDTSQGVRSETLSLLKSLPEDSFQAHAQSMCLFVFSAMTHINPDIRFDSTKFLNFILTTSPSEVLRMRWSKCLSSFLALFGWQSDGSDVSRGGFTSKRTITTFETMKPKETLQHLKCLELLLKLGIFEGLSDDGQKSFIHVDTIQFLLPSVSRPYAYLNIFPMSSDMQVRVSGSKADDEINYPKRTAVTEDPESRRVILGSYLADFKRGIQAGMKQGGEIGRLCKSTMTLLDEHKEG